MSDSSSEGAPKGNNPERWQKFLNVLDDKLQLGLLDQMQKIKTYHFEEDTLYLEPQGDQEANYLAKDAVFHQLELLAQDAIGVDKVKIKKPSE